MNRRRGWLAPADDGAILVDPPPARLDELLETNRRRLEACRRTFLGHSLAEVRAASAARIRAVIGDLAHDRFLVAGHQPDLFHPGVWVKNFALNGFARRGGLVPLNVVIDGDTIKSTLLAVPVLDAEPSRVRRVSVAFDTPAHGELFAARHVEDAKLFTTFAERVRVLTRDWPFEPLLASMWHDIVRDFDAGEQRLAVLFASARRRMEECWGCRNVEVKQATACAMPEIIGELLGDLPRFRACYNNALQAYRRKYRVRSRQHPAPALAADGDRLEAPLWWLEDNGMRRERLFVRLRGDVLELSAGASGRLIEVKRGDPRLHDELAAAGVRLVTRALTTTLLLRLGLADAFIHGIGGAKYDEVTDDIIRHYAGIEPPEYLVVTGTLRLPLPRWSATIYHRRELWRERRDLVWHPERYPGAARELVQEKQSRLAVQPATTDERRQRFRELLRLTEGLRPAIASRLDDIERKLARCDDELAANEVLMRRDYSLALFPGDVLKKFCTRAMR